MDPADVVRHYDRFLAALVPGEVLGPADEVQFQPVDFVTFGDLSHDRQAMFAYLGMGVIESRFVRAAVRLLDYVFGMLDREERTEWVGAVERPVMGIVHPDRCQYFFALGPHLFGGDPEGIGTFRAKTSNPRRPAF